MFQKGFQNGYLPKWDNFFAKLLEMNCFGDKNGFEFKSEWANYSKADFAIPFGATLLRAI